MARGVFGNGPLHARGCCLVPRLVVPLLRPFLCERGPRLQRGGLGTFSQRWAQRAPKGKWGLRARWDRWVLTGATGAEGPMGPQGATGLIGPMGLVGPMGPQGLTGATGAEGPMGPPGAIGLTGATGPVGLTGAQGPTGSAGAVGPMGPVGATGANGAAGTSVTTAMEAPGANCQGGRRGHHPRRQEPSTFAVVPRRQSASSDGQPGRATRSPAVGSSRTTR